MFIDCFNPYSVNHPRVVCHPCIFSTLILPCVISQTVMAVFDLFLSSFYVFSTVRGMPTNLKYYNNVFQFAAIGNTDVTLLLLYYVIPLQNKLNNTLSFTPLFSGGDSFRKGVRIRKYDMRLVNIRSKNHGKISLVTMLVDGQCNQYCALSLFPVIFSCYAPVFIPQIFYFLRECT